MNLAHKCHQVWKKNHQKWRMKEAPKAQKINKGALNPNAYWFPPEIETNFQPFFTPFLGPAFLTFFSKSFLTPPGSFPDLTVWTWLPHGLPIPWTPLPPPMDSPLSRIFFLVQLPPQKKPPEKHTFDEPWLCHSKRRPTTLGPLGPTGAMLES